MTSMIIKAGEKPSPLGRGRRIDLTDHLDEARARVEEAHRKAGVLVAAARETAAGIHAETARNGFEQGYRKGYVAGETAGHADALTQSKQQFQAEQGDLISAMSDAVKRFDILKEDLLIQAKRDVLELAVAIGEKVTRRLGVYDREAARANAEAAIELLSPGSDLTLHVNPADGDTMRRFAGELAGELNRLQHVNVIEDDSVSPGGCLVASGDRSVDARIDTQLDQIAELLIGSSDDTPVLHDSTGSKPVPHDDDGEGVTP